MYTFVVQNCAMHNYKADKKGQQEFAIFTLNIQLILLDNWLEKKKKTNMTELKGQCFLLSFNHITPDTDSL